ncbi:MAG TPA: hypothetical protein V6D48_06725 [Oculatellaceae cyanobacterium]
MNKKLKKKSSKELFLVGIASASIFLSGSALALETTNNSNSSQLSNNSTSLADSTVSSKEVLAQTNPEDNTPPPTDVRPRENPPPAPAGTSGESGSPSSGSDGSSGVGTPPPSDAKPRGSTPPTTGTSPTENSSSGAATDPKPGTWLCINNPNPSCKG